MSKHTQGPWTHDDIMAGRILGPDGIAICSVYGSSSRAEEDDANQILIAAAPDMLAALEGMVEMATHHMMEPEERRDILSNARAAIAKAKGADQ